MTPSDEVLIKAHRKGDQAAFAELVRRYADPLYGYLLRMSRSPEQAEDFFQDTFRKAYEKVDSYNGQGKFKSWLYSIAYHAAIDGIRKKQREPRMLTMDIKRDCGDSGCPVVSPPQAAPQDNPYHSSVLAEQKQQVKQALEKLPPKQRTTLIMSYYQGMTYREIAQTLDCSLGTVKSQMFRALKTLAGALPDVKGGVE